VKALFDSFGLSTAEGALEDLVPRSRPLKEINRFSSPLLLHNVMGVASTEQIQNTESSLLFRLAKLACRSLRRGLNTIHRKLPHDLIVDTPSQQGGLSSASEVLGVIHTRITALFVGLGELQATTISQTVINLLNQSLGPPTFTKFAPGG